MDGGCKCADMQNKDTSGIISNKVRNGVVVVLVETFSS